MRWAFETDGTRLAVHDHKGNTVLDEPGYGGVSWTGVPDEVRRAMLDAARQAAAAGEVQYALATLACLAADEVVQGGPELTEDVDQASTDGTIEVDTSVSIDLRGLF